VYAKVAHEDLRDLRMFDARGEAVPYEIEPTPVRPATESESAPLPLFALPRDAYATLDGVQLIIRSPQGAVELRAGAALTGAQPIASYVLDARELKSPLSALILHWPDQAPEFSTSPLLLRFIPRGRAKSDGKLKSLNYDCALIALDQLAHRENLPGESD
jgi:Protein of unknown function (DUF3999)